MGEHEREEDRGTAPAAPTFDIEELRAMLAGISDPDTRRRLAASYAHTHPGTA